MTRVNLVDPKLLVRQHLVAEYREVPRIFGLVREAELRGLTPAAHAADPRVPANYTLGPGHCRFFYRRLSFIQRRFAALCGEMKSRGYRAEYASAQPVGPAGAGWWLDEWEPNPVDVEINVRRINERLRQMGLTDRAIVL